jgi:hypothetical protein
LLWKFFTHRLICCLTVKWCRKRIDQNERKESTSTSETNTQRTTTF